MLKYHKRATATALAVILAAPVYAGPFGLGRPALPQEIAAWDLDVSPDGTGLPAGSGSVLDGEEIFADQCAVCHGDFAEGVGNWPKLAGGADTLDHKDPLKTVGSYWPYLSTTWDYVNRSMPFGNAQTLKANEVYAIVAYILYSNDLVDEDFVLSRDNFLDVEMPNANGFILDDRPEAEYAIFNQACMSDCKETVEITMRALVLDVTPQETAALVEAAPDAVVAVTPVALDAELVAKGAKTFKKCKACHQVGEGAKNRTGPILTGIVGAPAGQVDGFKYSRVMAAAAEAGLVWTVEELSAFLTKPKTYMKGTKMSFSGLKKENDIAAIIAYLQSLSQ